MNTDYKAMLESTSNHQPTASNPIEHVVRFAFSQKVKTMNDYLWETEEELPTNTRTMNDYIINHISDEWGVLFCDGSYAEIQTEDHFVYEVHASGNGDFRNHKVEFKLMYGDAT